MKKVPIWFCSICVKELGHLRDSELEPSDGGGSFLGCFFGQVPSYGCISGATKRVRFSQEPVKNLLGSLSGYVHYLLHGVRSFSRRRKNIKRFCSCLTKKWWFWVLTGLLSWFQKIIRWYWSVSWNSCIWPLERINEGQGFWVLICGTSQGCWFFSSNLAAWCYCSPNLVVGLWGN